MSKGLTLLLNILLVCFLFPLLLYGNCTEIESINLGNISFHTYGTGFGYFSELPQSKFVVLSGSESMILFDRLNKGIRDGQTADYLGCIMPDNESGWINYFTLDHNLYIQKISSIGEFGKIELQSKSFDITPVIVGIPERQELWFFSKKIEKLFLSDNKWTEYNYPSSWDLNFSSRSTYLTEDKNILFLKFYGKTIESYQLMKLELLDGFTQAINADKLFTGSVCDIDKWRNHQDKYIILKSSPNGYSICLFDSETESIDTIFDDIENSVRDILQSESGKYMYLFGKAGSSDFNILDFEEKAIDKYVYTLDEDFSFMNKVYLNLDMNLIINQITKSHGDGTYERIPVILNLSDLSLQYFQNLTIRDINSCIYIQEDHTLIVNGNDSPYLEVLDFETGNVDRSINLTFDPNDMCILEEFNNSILVVNFDGSDFCRIKPLGRRELHDSGLYGATHICEYPSGEGAILERLTGNFISDHQEKEYFFDDKKNVDLVIPYYVSSFEADPDLIQNQIIGISNVAEFIKPHGNVDVWMPSDIDNLKFWTSYFDKDDNSLWMVYYKSDFSNNYFYKISTQTHEIIDSFEMPEEKYITKILVDSSKNLIYLITENETNRKLMILNKDNKNVLSEIPLLDNEKEFADPCIVPVPEQNKLFLWDHYGAWCVNTDTFQLIYGNPPEQTKKITIMDSRGFWHAKSDSLILLDFISVEGHIYRHIYKFLIETGEVKSDNLLNDKSNEYIETYISKDKNSIKLLNGNKARIETIYFDPEWENPATITPSTNYIQLCNGDNAKFSVNIKNEYDFSQDVTAYIWLYTPDGTMLFFDGINLTTNISGIPLTLPANLDITGDILAFTMPAGVPEGFYNFNAVLINENGDRGPVGTWNFYVKD